jgi:uncharacterized protein YdeI (BOF family)
MKTITVIAAVFSLTILSSCSQDYSSPTSENKSPTVTSKSETKTETKSETKTETAPAATPEGTSARKADTLPAGKDPSAPGPSATNAKRSPSADRSGVASDRGSSPEQGQVSATGQKSVGVEQITSNRMLTIEGVLLKIDGDSYLVKDLSGNEVTLRADNKTKKDGNLTVGDRIMARLEGAGVAASSITKR